MTPPEERQNADAGLLIGDIDCSTEIIEAEASRILLAARKWVGELSREGVLENHSEIKKIIGQLVIAGKRSSRVHQVMAQAKSLRQSDNPEQRTDLYSFPEPTETLEGIAALRLGLLLAFIEKESTSGT